MTQHVELDPEAKLIKGQLLDVIVETTLDARYSFPDVDGKEALKLVQNFDRALSLPQLTLVNESGSCLILHTRIIKTIRTEQDGVTTAEWKRPR